MIRQNDDDDYDERGVLKDGRKIRVSLMMRDGMSPLQRAVAQHSVAMRLHDGFGGPVGHKPGYVFSTDASLNDAKERAYAAYDAELCEAYKHPQGCCGDIEASDEAHDARAVMDKRARAYAVYDADLANAWRGPPDSGKW
jgi:hypothetical protein